MQKLGQNITPAKQEVWEFENTESNYRFNNVSVMGLPITNSFIRVNRDNKVDDFENSICVVPALCCDLSGNRIGYGKGCYDRFLSEYTGVKICLVYGDNVFPSVESESTDVSVDLIVSDLFVKRT